MKTIYKYQLHTNGDQQVSMPKDAEIISIHPQYNSPCIWARVDTEKPKVKRLIHIDLTGGNSERKTNGVPIGTVLLDEGRFVVHVFDGGEG